MFSKSRPYALFLALSALLLIAAFSPAPSLAQIRGDADIRNLSLRETPASEGEKPDAPGAGVLLVKMLGALGIVVGVMLGLAWLWKKYAPRNATAAARNDVIRVVGSKILGGRRSLLLVRVRGQTLLLGVTPQRINCLTEIHEVEGDWARPAASTEDSKTSSAFQRQLGAMIDETLDD